MKISVTYLRRHHPARLAELGLPADARFVDVPDVDLIELRPNPPSSVTMADWPGWAQFMADQRAPGDRGVGDTVEHEVGIFGSRQFGEWFEATFGPLKPCPNCPQIWNRLYPYSPPRRG